MRVLIVGTSGQLATELRRTPRATGLALLPAPRIDLSDPAGTMATLHEHAPQLIINAGAYTAVDRAEDERDRAFAINGAGPGVLADWCMANGACLFHVSTDYVFDGQKATPYVETDETGPCNVYGASKLAGEHAIQRTLERHVILRSSWLFSAHGHNFVKTMLRLGAERSELRVVADQHGCPTPVSELARLIWRMAERLAESGSLPWGLYHCAGQPAATWFELARASLELRSRTLALPPTQVIPIGSSEFPSKTQRPTYSVLDCSRFAQAFGLELPSWQQALGDVVAELLPR